MAEFKVGDKVRFKEWEELKAEFGLNEVTGSIACAFHFTDGMNDEIDRDKIFTIADLKELEEGIRVWFTEEPSKTYSFTYSTDMIKLVEEGNVDEVADIGVPEITRNVINSWSNIDSPLLNNITIHNERGTGVFPISNIMRSKESTIHNILKMVFLQESLLDRHKVYLYVNDYTNPPKAVWGHFASNSRSVTKIVILTHENKETRESLFKQYKDYQVASSGSIECLLEKENYIFHRRNSVLLCYMNPEHFMSDDWWMDFFTVVFNKVLQTTDDHYKSLFSQGKFVELITYCESIKDKLLEEKKKKEFEEALTAVERIASDSMLTRVNRNIDTFKRDIRSYEEAIDNLYKNLKEERKTLAYILSGAIENANKDFIEIVRNDYANISVIKTTDSGYLCLYIVQPLLFFEDDDWSVVRENTLRRYASSNTKYVIDAVFSRKCEILLETGVQVSIDGNTNCTRWTGDFPYTRGIPNSHIARYDCWGDNRNPIKKALSEGKYDIAYAQIKSALAGINIVDTPVMENFCYAFDNSDYRNIKCIKDFETGEIMSIEEANKYYREKEKEEHEEN